MTDILVCADCDYKTKSWNSMRVHTLRNKHTNADWLIGHLIIRGREEDKPEIEQLRDKIVAARK